LAGDFHTRSRNGTHSGAASCWMGLLFFLTGFIWRSSLIV